MYAVWTTNWLLVIVAPLIMEIGHAYNHIRKIEPYPIRVLPLQTATYIVFIAVIFTVKKLMAG